MAVQPTIHPAVELLRAFAQGRLGPIDAQAVEEHVATCDACCRQLASVPDDTLLHLAREAATQGVKSDRPAHSEPISDPRTIPAELRDHPRYRVLSLIGTGGMGAVYKAEHRLMERHVALKVISPALLSNPATVERFRREFKAVAKLSHANIVAAHDADQAGDLHFLVMEFVEGISLDRLIAKNGPLPPHQACHLIRQSALGLGHIHDRGMVHRDIKPHNLMVNRKAQLKILDCGLARLVSVDADEPAPGKARAARPGATAEGMILGTPDYIAPEQIHDARSADIRADIYSLGCTLYFLLSGHPPFPKGTVHDKLDAHARQEPESILVERADIPGDLVRLVERMMAKNPDDRYQTPAEVARDLAPLAKAPTSASDSPRTTPSAALPATAVISQEIVKPATPARAATRARRGFREQGRDIRKWLVGGAVVAALLMLVALTWYFGRQPVDDPRAKKLDYVAAEPPTVEMLPRRVLFVIPSRGLWYADYGNVKSALESEGVEVVTASLSRQPSTNQPGSAWGKATPDIILDATVTAKRYGAIIFTGYDTSEFVPGGVAGEETRRLLTEFKSQGRFITAICVGQRVLALHGELDGKRAARNEYLKDFAGAVTEWVPDSVVPDGRLITAARATDGAALAAAIVAALRGKS